MFEQAKQVAQSIEGTDQQAAALRAIMPALAHAQRFGGVFGAFAALGLSDPIYYYIQQVAGWSAAFEDLAAGTTVRVLHEVTRIVGWVHPGWREIHAILSLPPETRSSDY